MTMRHGLMIGLVSLFWAAQASAFKVDGYFSGMTVAQLKQVAHSAGLELHSVGDGFNYFVTESGTIVPDGNFFFCKGTMFGYSRFVNFDTDYAQTLGLLLKRYGQPKSVKVKSEEEDFGTTHHFITTIIMTWSSDGDTIELSLSPQMRDENGALLVSRGATLTYTSKNSCSHQRD